jgi:hypothetical protein
MTDYTEPIWLDSGSMEVDTTPDGDGDLEVCDRSGEHVAYLREADQIALRDALNRIHPDPRLAAVAAVADDLADPPRLAPPATRIASMGIAQRLRAALRTGE